jgi:hypothetical protein
MEFEGFSMLDETTTMSFERHEVNSSISVDATMTTTEMALSHDFVSDCSFSDKVSETILQQPSKDQWQLAIDLNSFEECIDQKQMKQSIYVTGLTHTMTEEILEKLFESFGLALHEETRLPHVDVFFFQRSHCPRGDARIVFTSPEAAARAVEDMHHKIISNTTRLSVKKMDLLTAKILYAQFDTDKTEWKCSNIHECGQQVSIWKNTCPFCLKQRIFSPTGVAIQPNDWLCSM